MDQVYESKRFGIVYALFRTIFLSKLQDRYFFFGSKMVNCRRWMGLIRYYSWPLPLVGLSPTLYFAQCSPSQSGE